MVNVIPSILVLIFTLLSFSACKKEKFDGHVYKVFTLKEGDHYSSPREVSLFTDHKMKFHAKFDSSAIYPDQHSTRGVNKLWGFSDCGSTHQENGVRFGWEWVNNQLEISTYTYAFGERKIEFMAAIPLDSEVTYTIDTSGDQYILAIDGPGIYKTATAKRGCSGDGDLKYKDGPYFGGNETAPHEIKILIDEVKY